ncbi:class I SAM-dependent methyltransferase [Streptomyces sp. NPDC004393]|uniref:class I SAM-dependent methyltransferase n=1 Tax=Streptomyces sp. NPDC004533 TaxID=3154278 RepID=UPI0033A25373
MSEAPPTHAAAPTGGGPQSLDALYAVPPPWDIGRPQPALLDLAESGALCGWVLDVGCGTGEHTLMAARLGLEATGVDLATTALAAAERKARERGLAARFLQHDVLDLAALGRSFDTVLDSLVFHGFHSRDRGRYVDGPTCRDCAGRAVFPALLPRRTAEPLRTRAPGDP